MIIAPVEERDLLTADTGLPTLNLPGLGIAPEHYDAIERAVKDLSRQGVEVKIIKE